MIKLRSKIRLLPMIKLPTLHENTPVKSESTRPIQMSQMSSLKYKGLPRESNVEDSPTQKKIRKTHLKPLPSMEPLKSWKSENNNHRSSRRPMEVPFAEINSDRISAKLAKPSKSEFAGQRSSKRQLLVPPSEINIAKISNREAVSGTRSQLQNKRSSNRQFLVPSSEVNFNMIHTIQTSKSPHPPLQRSKKRQLVVPSSEINPNEISQEYT